MNKVRLTNWLMLIIWLSTMALGVITIYYFKEQEKLEKENQELKQQVETLKINNQDCILDFNQELAKGETMKYMI